MKNRMIIPATILAVLGLCNNANAYCTDWGEQNYFHADLSKCSNESASLGITNNCATLDDTTIVWQDDDGCHYIPSCATCPSGYSRSSEMIDTGWQYSDFCWANNDVMDEMLQNLDVTLYMCEEGCNTPCTNCNSTDWASSGTGYEKMIARTCNCGVCESDVQYRCAAGYYGSSKNGTSGCTRCPTLSGAYITSSLSSHVVGTSAAGSERITNCYIKSGTYYDSTGTFKMTANCSYKN